MRSLQRLLPIFLTIQILQLLAAIAMATDIRFVTDNDFLGSNETQDDLYTFAVTVEIDKGPLTWTVAENAFTDREAGLRFDETHVTAGRLLPEHWFGRWSVWTEAGVAHVGEGLLGQDIQNAFHELIGSDEVHLDYVDKNSYHARLGVEAGRQNRVSHGLTVGPHLEAHSYVGFKDDALVGFRGRWQPPSTTLNRFEVDVTVGARYSRSSFEPLDNHLERVSEAAQLEISTPGGLVVNWSRNRYGTAREHVSLGFRIGGGESPRRGGPWRELPR
ncbi:MAG: hypothetical protein MPN21_25940 [Thermoanaerobaculia bacterium]|nr:hypothetical protein [Thermoanaerobaculia bacterium]